MTTYELLEGMTAAEVAADLRHAAEGARTPWAKPVRTLKALADAIDPPSSTVTDEMVDEVIDSMPQNLRSRTIVRAVLQAVERLGWLRDDPDDDEYQRGYDAGREDGYHDGRTDRHGAEWTDRLVMAEGLLRRLDFSLPYVLPDGAPRFWSVGEITVTVDPDEAEYLRSLTGEGSSDE